MAFKKSKKAIYNVSLNDSHFPFVNKPKWYTRHKDYGNGKSLLTITLDDILSNSKANPDNYPFGVTPALLVTSFLDAVIAPSENGDARTKAENNMFTVSYENGTKTFFGSPVICLDNKQPTLIFGSESKHSGLTFNRIPLTMDNAGTYVNGHRLAASFYEREDVETNQKIKVPIFVLEYRSEDLPVDMFFNINGKFSDPDYYILKDIFEIQDPANRMSELTNFLVSLYGASCSLGKMFSQYFFSDSFPSEGVVIPVVGGQVIKGDAGMTSVILRVDTSNFPAVDVLVMDKDAQGKTTHIPAPINEVTGIFVNEKHTAGSIYLDASPNELPTVDKPWYLHVKGINSNTGKCDHVPNHVLYDADYVPPEIIALKEHMSKPTYFLGGLEDF